MMMKKSTKKALLEFRCKLEDAILGNYLLEDPDGDASTGKSSGPEKELTIADVLNFGNPSPEESLRDITLWGVPLLPSKGHAGTDVILLKFLKARDFKVKEAFEMLQRTLIWRKEFKTEGVLEENLGSDLNQDSCTGSTSSSSSSTEKEGSLVCYNICGIFNDKELYEKAFGSEEKSEEFLRRILHSMENKGAQKLSFKDGGVDSSMLHVTDMKSSGGLAKKEFCSSCKKALLLFQENYPEIIFRSVFVNVPFWYYAYHKLLFRYRVAKKTRGKNLQARCPRVAKTLLKLMDAENIPVHYGGLQRDDDDEFSPEDGVSELIVKSGAVESIQIPAEAGVTLVWDLMVVGWDVTYKEEFIPHDECSYRVLIRQTKKLEESVRNSFYISEPGKILLTIDNDTFRKKRVLYRFKSKPTII
ncbi:PREDICTED: patellin-4-like [Nelumbo nucifera]|uniref:Patellin-4-like n=1 Tax=Nelumbo nucifera TaxID=4432 RepID=A0A1U8AJ14_NELNU|nr:PREDICTED: patellin-4-like [Nelumbo nucifera]